MPLIDPHDEFLTVLNLFRTDSAVHVDRLVNEMCEIVNAAAYPGWMSSTVHRGEEKFGTANFIQWRGQEDLESRYAGSEFKHHTVPVFRQMTTFVRLMQNEVVSVRSHPEQDGVTEISPARDDHTVIEVLDVDPADQHALLAAIDDESAWLLDAPGFRSQVLLRGIRSRATDDSETGLATIGTDNDFVVTYTQWESSDVYDAHREADQPAAHRVSNQRIAALTKARHSNTYRVVHTRSASQPVL